MRLRLLVAITMLTMTLATFITGCGDDDTVSGSPNTAAPVVLSVTPADGSSAVPTSTTISVKFGMPMDTLSVMHNFHLSGGQNMHEWMDSVSHFGGMGHMSMGHMDNMMQWMDSIETHGDFHWNYVMDSCEFIPSSSISASEEHMIFIYEGGMMGHGGGMMGSQHDDDQYHYYHFSTGE